VGDRPVWGRIDDPTCAELLLAEGRPHLEDLLSRSNVRLVLLNGAAVVRQVRHTELAHLDEVGKIPLGGIMCQLFVGEGRGISYVGWSTNLQSSFGVSNEFKQRLARQVRELAAGTVSTAPRSAEAPVTVSGLAIDNDGFLRRGIKVSSKREFADLLLHWLQSSRTKTIADVGTYGRTAWIHVDLGSHAAVLNADTKRAAVEAYLERVRRLGPELPWRAIANNRGTINKIIVSDDPAQAAGWYLYLRKPLQQPEQL
jgi:hypothetical protein